MPRISIRSIRYRRPTHPTWDLELERRIVLDRDALPGYWDFPALFGRDSPVEAEIGFGKGRFLLAAAETWPERNWLGIEYAPPCVALVAERAAKRNLRNVRLVRAAAESVVPEHIPPDSVRAYHIYFPDPWPKKRHHKRRLIQPPFAAELFRTILPGGWLHVATDFEDYFEEMVSAITGAGFHLVDVPDAREDEVFRTNYEMRFIRQAKPIYRARFMKP